MGNGLLRVAASVCLLLAWFTCSGAAQAQDYRYQSQALQRLAATTLVTTNSAQALVPQAAAKYYPNRGLSYAASTGRAAFRGQLAEELLAHKYPELRVEANQSHKFRDVYRSCSSGAQCIDGKLALQVKVLKDPKNYYGALSDPSYEQVESFVIPREHRAAVRADLRARGRPDLASKVTDRYDIRRQELDDLIDSPTHQSFRMTQAVIALALVAEAVQHCHAGSTASHCLEHVATSAALLYVSTKATGALAAQIGRSTGQSAQWSSQVAGATVAAVIEVFLAYQEHGLSQEFLVESLIGIAAVGVSAKAFTSCTAVAAPTGPFAPIFGLVCGVGSYMGVKKAGAELTDRSAENLAQEASSLELTLVKDLAATQPEGTRTR